MAEKTVYYVGISAPTDGPYTSKEKAEERAAWMTRVMKKQAKIFVTKKSNPRKVNPLGLFKKYYVTCDGKKFGPFKTMAKAKSTAEKIARVLDKPAKILGQAGTTANPRRKAKRKTNPKRKRKSALKRKRAMYPRGSQRRRKRSV
jgi:hypothetical protein